MELKVLKNDTKPWYGDGLSFTCTQCGNCCTGGPGYVWITRKEIRRLAEFLGLSPEEVVERYCRKVGGRFSLNERRLGPQRNDCIFLKEVPAEPHNGDQVVQSRRICEIYPVRPLQCRTWPFWKENLATRRAWDHAARRCPGMNSGPVRSVEQIEQLRDATEWPE
jgi:uncharacterized protein